MPRTARPGTGAALALAAAGTVALAAVWALAAPAYGVGTGTDGEGGLDVSPSPVVPGGTVTAQTAACGADGTASGDAGAVGGGRFTLTPTPSGGAAAGRFRVPPSAQPDTYEIVARCAQDGRRLTGDLVVALAPDRQPVGPRGSVKTGVGGAFGPDPVQTAAGVAALAVAAAGGTWLLHRRARGDGI